MCVYVVSVYVYVYVYVCASEWVGVYVWVWVWVCALEIDFLKTVMKLKKEYERIYLIASLFRGSYQFKMTANDAAAVYISHKKARLTVGAKPKKTRSCKIPVDEVWAGTGLINYNSKTELYAECQYVVPAEDVDCSHLSPISLAMQVQFKLRACHDRIHCNAFPCLRFHKSLFHHRRSFMTTVVVRAIAGDVVLGPLDFEAPPCVSDIKSRLQECLELLPGQEILLLKDSAILSDTTKLQGGSTEDPVALNMVTSKQSLQAVVWGNSTAGPQWSKVSEQLERGIVAVSCTHSAFAALTESGSVITWGEGEEEDGGDSDGVLGLDQGVLQVLGNEKAFVARKTGGELVVWGDENAGGKPDAEIRAQLRDGVVAMARTMQAFAAVKENGEVVVWGNPEFGGDSSSAGSLQGVVSVVGTWGQTSGAFAALTDTGGVVTWGDPELGGDLGSKAEQVAKDVKSITASGCSFAALKTTGEVVCWGDPERGGEPVVFFSDEDSGMAQYSVKEKLSGGVVSIAASDDVFMALKEGGEVVGWGMGEDGAHLDENLVKELGNDVVSISANVAAFAALKVGGRVVTWGPYTEKGLTQLESGVVNIPSFSWPSMMSFAALKDNGSLVVWSGISTSVMVQTPHEELQSGVVDVVGNPCGYVALKYAAALTSDA